MSGLWRSQSLRPFSAFGGLEVTDHFAGGDVVPKDVNAAVATIKTKRTIQFVDAGMASHAEAKLQQRKHRTAILNAQSRNSLHLPSPESHMRC